MPDGCRGCCMMILLVPLMICVLIVCVAVYMINNSTDTPLGGSFKPSVSEAVAFDNEIARASNTAASERWFALRFTESQLSSWMSLEGQEFADQHGYPFPFEDLQVGIDGGRMTFYGNVTYYNLGVPLQIVIEPKVDSRGHIDFDIHDADWGGVPLPGFVLDSVTDQIESKLFEAIKSLPDGYRLYPETLTVNAGVFEVQGTVGN